MSTTSIPVLGDEIPQRGNKVSRWLGRRMLAKRGWSFSGNFPNVPKAVLIGAPHTSNWDGYMSLALTLAIGLDVKMVTKESWFRGPWARLLRWMGFVPIDRSKGASMIAETVRTFEEHKKWWIAIAPEGTRSQAEKLKTGFYRIASAAKVPIYPMTMDYKNRRIVCGDLLHPSGNIELDMPQILDFFSSYTPCRPELLSKPLKDWRANKK